MPSDIAEGFEGGSKKEIIQFLYVAQGPSGEVRDQLEVCFELGYINKENLGAILSQTRDLLNQLNAVISWTKKRIRR